MAVDILEITEEIMADKKELTKTLNHNFKKLNDDAIEVAKVTGEKFDRIFDGLNTIRGEIKNIKTDLNTRVETIETEIDELLNLLRLPDKQILTDNINNKKASE